MATKNRIMSRYNQAIDILVMLLILIMMGTLFLAFYKLLYDLYIALPSIISSGDVGINQLVINVLSVFIIIELFRTFMDYVEFQRIRLHVLADVTIVFIMRELLIGFYSHSIQWPEMLAIGFLIAVLAGARTVAIRVSPASGQKS